MQGSFDTENRNIFQVFELHQYIFHRAEIIRRHQKDSFRILCIPDPVFELAAFSFLFTIPGPDPIQGNRRIFKK